MFECICWCLYPKVSGVYSVKAIEIMRSASKDMVSTNLKKNQIQTSAEKERHIKVGQHMELKIKVSPQRS